MSSDSGAIMDAIITAAEGAVSGLTGARTVKYAAEIADEDFPYLHVYSPHETVDVGEFQLTTAKTRVEMLLFVKDETQEALLLKMDLIRDAIAADRTLGGVVQMAHIVERVLLEPGDTTIDTNAGYMVLEAVEQTGRILSATINVDVRIKPGQSDWAGVDTTVAQMVLSHFGSIDRLSSNLRADQDTLSVSTWYYQMAWTLTDHVEHGSSVNAFNASFRITLLYHMAPSDDEITLIRGTMLQKLDGLLNPNTWMSTLSTVIVRVLNDTPTLSLDDFGRVD